MPTITLTAVVDENGHLSVDVPLPPGPVEVVVRSVEQQDMSREEVRAKLKAAGLLDEDDEAWADETEFDDDEFELLEDGESSAVPQTREWIEAQLRADGMLAEEEFPDAFELSLEEEVRLGTLLKGPRPVEDYVNEDREERF